MKMVIAWRIISLSSALIIFLWEENQKLNGSGCWNGGGRIVSGSLPLSHFFVYQFKLYAFHSYSLYYPYSVPPVPLIHLIVGVVSNAKYTSNGPFLRYE